MYTMYIDGELAYSPIMSKREGYYVISPKVTLSQGRAGSATFILTPDNIMYDKINKLKSIVTIFQDNKEIFRGRVINETKDFNNRKSIYAEGDLAFLLDSPVRPYSFTGDIPELVKKFINNHNANVDEAKQFRIGKVTVTDANNYINRSNSSYSNTLDEFQDKLVNTHGGYLRTRLENGIRYLDYLEEYEGNNEQVIKFGENLLDISQYIDAEDVFTCLIPLGAVIDEETGGRLTIKSVNGNIDYIEDEDAIGLFGKVWKVQIWDDVTVASNLLRKSRAYLKKGIEMAVTLDINALDLHLLDIDTDRINVGCKTRVISPPHNIDGYFTCTNITLDLLNPDLSEYCFGASYTTLTEKQAISTKGLSAAVNMAKIAADNADIAVENTDIIANQVINKQDKLEPGDNIVINGNVISSEKTEYGLNISDNKLCLEEDGTSDHVPLATEQMINNIPIDANITNVPTVYSKNEQKIGVWINGKSIYQKTIHIPQLPNSSVLEIDPNVNNLYEIIYFNGYCAPINKSYYPLSTTRLLPNADDSIVIRNAVRTDSQNGNVRVITYSDWSAYEGWLTIRYTKTTD